MEIYRDGIEILIVPESAKCIADEEQRNPQDIEICPLGCSNCSGDCECYTE